MPKTAPAPTNVPQPQFKDMKFPTQKAFNEWLNTETHIIIGFEKREGLQLRMWVHKTGEILHCNAHERIYNGSFVKLEEIYKGQPVMILNTHFRQTMYSALENLVIDDITFLNK